MTQTQVVRAAVYFRFTFNSTPSTKCQIKYLPLRIVIYAREYTEQAGVEKSKRRAQKSPVKVNHTFCMGGLLLFRDLGKSPDLN